jgi:hypothetical protein
MKEQSKNGVPETCWCKWPSMADLFIRTGTRVSHHGQESFSTQRPDTLTQTFSILELFPCSQTADHTLHQSPVNDVEHGYSGIWVQSDA